MIRFLKLHGVDVGESASLPQIPRTPEGRAMGAVPGWTILVDPDYVDLSAESIRNRAQAGDMLQKTSSGSLALDQFPNGETSFDFDGHYNFLSTQVGFNPDAWSVFTVAHPAPDAPTLTTIFRSVPTTPTTEPDMGVRIGFSANGNNFIIWEYGTDGHLGGVPQRLSFN